LTYWVVFAVFSTIEVFSDTIVWWFPFYWSAKVMFLVYLQLPQFRGAEFLYNTFIRQLFQKHAPAIEAKVRAAA
jgi:receptor expression-enhancing protein 5/6